MTSRKLYEAHCVQDTSEDFKKLNQSTGMCSYRAFSTSNNALIWVSLTEEALQYIFLFCYSLLTVFKSGTVQSLVMPHWQTPCSRMDSQTSSTSTTWESQLRMWPNSTLSLGRNRTSSQLPHRARLKQHRRQDTSLLR